MGKKFISIIFSLVLTGMLSACGHDAAVSGEQESFSGSGVSLETASESVFHKESDMNAEEEEMTAERAESPEEEIATYHAESKENAAAVKTVEEGVSVVAEKEPEVTMEAAGETTESAAGRMEMTKESVGQSGSSSATSSVTTPVNPGTPIVHTCDYDQGSETMEAGCLTDGVMTYTCSCGETKSVIIPAIGHNIVSESKAETCTENGYERKACSTCGHVESETVINATGHMDGTVQYFPCEPFCTSGCVGWYVCGRCGDSYDHQDFPALGHDPVQYNYRAGNCMQVSMWDVKCNRCEERMEFDVQGAIDPDVHDYITVNLKKWDDTIGHYVEYQVVRCSRCSKEQ